MKIYIAGRLCTKEERESLEKIDSLCKSCGCETFLPHRDVGLAKSIKEVDKIFQGDILKGFKDIDLVVACLEGLHIGAGTAWEIGYAYAKGIPVIGIKTDEPVSEALEYLSSIIISSVKIASSFEELEKELRKFKAN